MFNLAPTLRALTSGSPITTALNEARRMARRHLDTGGAAVSAQNRPGSAGFVVPADIALPHWKRRSRRSCAPAAMAGRVGAAACCTCSQEDRTGGSSCRGSFLSVSAAVPLIAASASLKSFFSRCTDAFKKPSAAPVNRASCCQECATANNVIIQIYSWRHQQ